MNSTKSNSKKGKTVSTLSGPFAKRPREMLVWILQMFSMYEVAQLQRLVSREFRDAGQERICDRGGRSLLEEAMAFLYGYDYQTIDKAKGLLLLQASFDAGCKTALLRQRLYGSITNRREILKYGRIDQMFVKEPLTEQVDIWTLPDSASDDFYIYTRHKYQYPCTTGVGFVMYVTPNDVDIRMMGYMRDNPLKILKDLKEISTSSPYHWVDYYIGEWYAKGFGGEEKKNQAVKWTERAANKGNTSAMYQLGKYYASGELGVIQSFTKAHELYTLAADKGDAIAQFHLGLIYLHGWASHSGSCDLVMIDFNRCVELWEQSANQGHIEAQFRLSDMYLDGSEDNKNGNPMTIPVNDPLHFKWALAAAKQNHIGAQTYTADCYENGRGVEQNYASAFEWWMKAAEQGFIYAQYELGEFFSHKLLEHGGELDIEQALFWYRKAAAQGDQDSIDEIAEIEEAFN